MAQSYGTGAVVIRIRDRQRAVTSDPAALRLVELGGRRRLAVAHEAGAPAAGDGAE